MALNKAQLQADIKSLSKQLSKMDNQEEAMDEYARQLSYIIDAYIRTMTITVNTTGTAAAQTGIGLIS
jgi:hypothetical protein